VAKVGLGVQHISEGPEVIHWESKIDAGSSPAPGQHTKNVRKMPHTTHKGGSWEVSHVQKFNKQVGWLREKGIAASLRRSGLK
jgi:DNA mismatch repair protein MutH